MRPDDRGWPERVGGRGAVTEPPWLALGGLSAIAERVYLFVVDNGRTRPADLVDRFDLTRADATAQLEELRALGLVSRSSRDGDAYVAVDPRVALTAVTDRLDAEVRRIRDHIPALTEQYARSVAEDAGTPATQVVTDPGAVASWYVRLQHQAQHELVIFDRPPYVSSSSLEPLEAIIIGRGVSWRAVYTADSFTRDGAWEETARLAEQGEQGRIVPELPIKLVVADRRVALVALSLDGVSNDALVTESPPLVALLQNVFEEYWSRSLPLSAANAAGVVPGERVARGATREEQSILALIGSGLTDEAIAARLGLSVRSLRRRTQQLMAALGATNRFQAGVEAARRGWV